MSLGNPQKRVRKQRPPKWPCLKTYIEESSIPVPETGCWLWTKNIDVRGYGATALCGKPKAHRVSYEAFHGRLPEGMFVLHSCDTRCCVNPGHLRAGTHDENMHDKVLRNRCSRMSARIGAEHCNAKLNDQAVIAIRASKDSSMSLGKRFGVSHSVISLVRARKAWHHVPEAC